jgi:hypothetical protein
MLRYIGKGAFLKGVPRKNLSVKEARRFGGKDRLIESGLYKEIKLKPVKKPIEKKAEE